MNKVLFCVGVVLLAASGLSQTDAKGPVVSPASCPTVQPPVAGLNITCQTTDPNSPVYLSANGGAYTPLVGITAGVTSINGRTGAVKIPIAGAALQCSTITGTITIGAAGAVTITNAVGTGCNF